MKNVKKKRFSRIRKAISQYMKIASKIPTTHITSEIRIPGLRVFCKRHGVTYTPVIMKTIASIREKYPIISSIYARDMKLQENIFYYDQIDLSLAIEKNENGESFATFTVIRDINKKTIYELSDEIKRLAALPYYKMPDALMRLLLVEMMPNIIKKLVIKFVSTFPSLYRYFFGTMGLSNLGKYGIKSFDTLFLNNFGYAISSIEEKPVIENETLQLIPVLHITQTSNHCIVDGAESARILAEIKRVFESDEYITICENEDTILNNGEKTILPSLAC